VKYDPTLVQVLPTSGTGPTQAPCPDWANNVRAAPSLSGLRYHVISSPAGGWTDAIASTTIVTPHVSNFTHRPPRRCWQRSFDFSLPSAERAALCRSPSVIIIRHHVFHKIRPVAAAALRRLPRAAPVVEAAVAETPRRPQGLVSKPAGSRVRTRTSRSDTRRQPSISNRYCRIRSSAIRWSRRHSPLWLLYPFPDEILWMCSTTQSPEA